MPNEKVRPGQPFDVAARTWNELIDAKDFILKYKGIIQALAKLKLPSAPIPTDVITVKNITAEDRLAGEVLELGDVVFTRVRREEIGFEADTVSHTGGRSYCILAKPLPCGETGDEANGKLGPAHISGICIAQVDIIATTDRYAYVKPSETILTSGKAGQFKILGPVDATGEQTVAVTFADDDGAILFGKLDGTMVEGGSATVSIYDWSGTSWDDTLVDVTAIDYFLGAGDSWDASTRVAIKWSGRAWVVIQASCDPDSGGGGGGGSPSSQSPATLSGFLGGGMSGGFYPGGLDYGAATFPYDPAHEYDSLFQK